MKTSDRFVQALESEGVECIFGIPGEGNLDLLGSLDGSKIKLPLTRHEQAAGFMAATYGRLTGRAGVCIATLGPRATNLVTAAGYAQLGGMPMVRIAGQRPVKQSKQGQFQIPVVVDMMGPLTTYTHQLVSGARVPAHTRGAFRLAQEERPGAIHLELAGDVANRCFRDQGLNFGNHDFVKYPEAYGAKEYRIDAANERLPLLKTTYAEPGVHVIDVPVDYTASHALPNHEIRRRSSKV